MSAVLRRTLDEIVNRHESLRTVFPKDEQGPWQRVLPPQPQPLPILDLSTLAVDADGANAREAAAFDLRADARAPFDLVNGRYSARCWPGSPKTIMC